MHKTWNVRDQTKEDLRKEAERLYKQIEANYKMTKMTKKVHSLDDAKKIIDQIWIMKKWSNDIEMELLRRENTYETQTEDAGTH